MNQCVSGVRAVKTAGRRHGNDPVAKRRTRRWHRDRRRARRRGRGRRPRPGGGSVPDGGTRGTRATGRRRRTARGAGQLAPGPRRRRPGLAEAAHDLVRGTVHRQRLPRLRHLRRAGQERGPFHCAALRGAGPPAGVRFALRSRPAAGRALHPGARRHDHRCRLAAAAPRRRADRHAHHRQGHAAAARVRPLLDVRPGGRDHPEPGRAGLPLGLPPAESISPRAAHKPVPEGTRPIRPP